MTETTNQLKKYVFHSINQLEPASAGRFNKDVPHFYLTRAGVARVCRKDTSCTETGWSRVEQTKITQRQQAISQAWRPPVTKTGSWNQHRPLRMIRIQQRPNATYSQKNDKRDAGKCAQMLFQDQQLLFANFCLVTYRQVWGPLHTDKPGEVLLSVVRQRN